jgi:anti-sigma B factor antagonist
VVGEINMGVTFQEETIGAGLHLISLDGTLDAPGTMTIEDSFRDHLLSLGGSVIIDLSHVDFMSSYGLRMFLVAAKALMNAGGQLHLAAPRPKVMEVIRVAGYDTMFPVYDSVEEAAHYLSNS